MSSGESFTKWLMKSHGEHENALAYLEWRTTSAQRRPPREQDSLARLRDYIAACCAANVESAVLPAITLMPVGIATTRHCTDQDELEVFAAIGA